VDKVGMACSMHLKVNTCCKNLVRKLDGKRSLGRAQCRWEYNITTADFLMHQLTQKVCDKQINTTRSVFIYWAEALKHISTLMGIIMQ
jgi:hypothetical protein